MKIMVSACLLGRKCKYNGGDNFSEKVQRFTAGHEVIPVCPETAGGLPDSFGVSRDKEFRAGAEACLRLAEEKGIDLAVLQPRSPSCGVGRIYDGSFSGKLVPGSGVFAALLEKNGYRVMSADDLD